MYLIIDNLSHQIKLALSISLLGNLTISLLGNHVLPVHPSPWIIVLAKEKINKAKNINTKFTLNKWGQEKHNINEGIFYIQLGSLYTLKNASLLFCQEQNGNASVDCLSCQQCCLNFHASNHSHEDKIGQVRQTSLTANKRINDKWWQAILNKWF